MSSPCATIYADCVTSLMYIDSTYSGSWAGGSCILPILCGILQSIFSFSFFSFYLSAASFF